MSQPSDPDMRAAEYVLGTLPAEEAARVEQELAHDQVLQDEVGFWEERLGQLGLALTPVEPPADAWDAIRARLPAHDHVKPDNDQSSRTQRRPPRVWQGLAVAASVAALVLAGLLYVTVNKPAPAPVTPAYVSIFYDQPTSTGWYLTASTETGDMAVTAVGNYPLPAGKELRLWIIPEGGKPIASGIVPAEGTHSWSMSSQVAKLVRHPGTAIAVSMEVAGQPVSDGPQGPILWQAHVRRRG